jgi:hypothetical protein
MSWRLLKSLWTMGWALVRKLLLLPFVRRPGPEPWLSRLKQEALTPTAAGAWPRFSAAGRCIGCGLCGTVESSRAPYESILAAGRRPEDAPLATSQAVELRRLAAEIARVCPARVGVSELAMLVLDNAALVEGR